MSEHHDQGEKIEDREDEVITGNNLYRAYLLDVQSDPENPGLAIVYRRGDGYPETQSMMRAIVNDKEEAKGRYLYLDQECTQATKFEPHWNVALVQKVSLGKKRPGLDREWVSILMAREDLTAEEKVAELRRYT